jgi:dTDP-4-dehydrorhamnose reductase
MAIKVAKLLGLDESLIEAVNSASFPEPVIRAKKSGLKIDKAIKELNYKPLSFEEGIRKSFNIC